jgi:hypothetical protein
MPRNHEDLIIDAAVERALANLGGRLPPEVVENLRKSGRLALRLDPRAQEIVRMLRARPSVLRSGVLGPDAGELVPGEEDDEDEARSSRRKQ